MRPRVNEHPPVPDKGTGTGAPRASPYGSPTWAQLPPDPHRLASVIEAAEYWLHQAAKEKRLEQLGDQYSAAWYAEVIAGANDEARRGSTAGAESAPQAAGPRRAGGPRRPHDLWEVARRLTGSRGARSRGWADSQPDRVPRRCVRRGNESGYSPP